MWFYAAVQTLTSVLMLSMMLVGGAQTCRRWMFMHLSAYDIRPACVAGSQSLQSTIMCERIALVMVDPFERAALVCMQDSTSQTCRPGSPG